MIWLSEKDRRVKLFRKWEMLNRLLKNLFQSTFEKVEVNYYLYEYILRKDRFYI